MFGERIIYILSELLFEAVPLAILVGFIISLVKYKKCPPENERERKKYNLEFVKCPKEDTEKRKKYKIAAIVFGIILGVMVIAFVVLMLLLATAITHM